METQMPRKAACTCSWVYTWTCDVIVYWSHGPIHRHDMTMHRSMTGGCFHQRENNSKSCLYAELTPIPFRCLCLLLLLLFCCCCCCLFVVVVVVVWGCCCWWWWWFLFFVVVVLGGCCCCCLLDWRLFPSKGVQLSELFVCRANPHPLSLFVFVVVVVVLGLLLLLFDNLFNKISHKLCTWSWARGHVCYLSRSLLDKLISSRNIFCHSRFQTPHISWQHSLGGS